MAAGQDACRKTAKSRLGMVTHALWRLKQEYYEFEAILGEGVRLS